MSRRKHYSSPFIPKFQWEPKNAKQVCYAHLIETKIVTFAIGPAGTGKSFVSCAKALSCLDDKKVEEIVIIRAMTTAGEDFGFLPGTLQEKYAPFLAPIYDVIMQLNHPRTDELLNGEAIIPLPIGMVRGKTFDNCVVMVDEAQNLTKEQFELLLTRIGQNCRMIINGDPSQCDLQKGKSGLLHAITLLKEDPDVGMIEFELKDICRHDFVGRAIRAYAKDRGVT